MPASKKTVVLNLRDLPKTVTDGVYIGRGTKWGNPFVIGKDGTREECLAKYKRALWQNKALLAEVLELRGKKLLCFCAPQACHGHVLQKAIEYVACQTAIGLPVDSPKQPLVAGLKAINEERQAKLDDPKLIPSRWRKAGGMGSQFALQRDKDGVASAFPF